MYTKSRYTQQYQDIEQGYAARIEFVIQTDRVSPEKYMVEDQHPFCSLVGDASSVFSSFKYSVSGNINTETLSSLNI